MKALLDLRQTLNCKLISGGEVRMDTMSGNTALLHNKIDKSIRILAETSENQKKMNKVLTELIKYNGIMKQDIGKLFNLSMLYNFHFS